MAFVNFSSIEFNLVFANNSILECLLTFLAINPLVDLKIAKKAAKATEIGALKGIIIGKAIEASTIPNSESVIKNSFPKLAFDNLAYFFKDYF
jgi:hypothetical protein